MSNILSYKSCLFHTQRINADLSIGFKFTLIEFFFLVIVIKGLSSLLFLDILDIGDDHRLLLIREDAQDQILKDGVNLVELIGL